MGRGARAKSNSPADKRGQEIPAWPKVSYRGVPELAEAAALALEVRATVLDEPDQAPLLDLDALLRLGRFRVDLADLAADQGGLEAMMLPRPRGGWRISVDPRPNGGWSGPDGELRTDTTRHRLRFRVGHEIAHSFFFERIRGELRRRRRSTPREERFCDHFASALLVPPPAVRDLAPAAQSVVELYRRYDVSLHVAARAMASAHPNAAILIGFIESGDEQPQLQWASQGLEPSEGRALLADVAQKRTRGSTVTVAWLTAPRRQLIWVASRSELTLGKAA